MTSYLNTINSEGVELNINNTSGYGVVIGNSLTSILGSRTFGASTIGNITGTGTASFSSTVSASGLLTANSGLTSTAGATTLGATTIGAITGTSASFSSTLGVTGLATFGSLTSTAGATTLGATTIGAITGTTSSFSGQITSSVSTGTSPLVISSTTNVANLNASSINGLTFQSPGNIGGTTPSSATFTNLIINTSITNTSGTTTLGAITIGAITGTSATFSSTVGITGLLTANSGLTSTAGNTTLGSTTLGAITGTSATFSGSLGVTGATTLSSTLNTGAITGTTATFNSSVSVNGFTSTSGSTSLGTTSLSGNLSMGNNKITGLGSPTASTDAATKGYVDSAIQGIDTKLSCVVATTGAQNLSTDFENGDTIDGQVLTTGERVLIKNQVDPIENGIYVVNSSGSPSRSSDLLTGTSAAGIFAFIEKGNMNSDTGYVCSSNSGNDIVGTNSLTFVQFSSAGVVDAGTGLTKTGNVLSVNSSQTQITSVGSLSSLTTGTITGTSAIFSGLLTASNGFTSTIGATTLGTTSIGAITGTSATFSSTVGITGLLTANSGLTSTAGTTTLGSTTIGSITGTSATFSNTLGVTGATTLSSTLVVGRITNSDTAASSFINTTSGSLVQTSNFLGPNSSKPCIIIGKNSSDTNYCSVIYDSSNDSMDFQVGSGSNKVTVNRNSNSSTSNTSGGLILNSGIGISNTTDASSSTNGGTFTTAGGIAVAKKVYIGSSLDVSNTASTSGLLVRGATSGTVSILPQDNAGTFNFNLPTSSGLSGQVLVSNGGGTSPMTWAVLPTQSAPETYTTTGLQSQSTAVDVSGLFYADGNFDINMVVDVSATTSLKQIFKLVGVLSPSSGWSITSISVSGDDSGVNFSISAGGNIQYTSSTYTGFTSLVFTWARYSNTQGIEYLTLAGTSTGAVSIKPQPNAGNFNFNLPSSSGTLGQALVSGGGGSNPMTWSPYRTFVFSGTHPATNTTTAYTLPSEVTNTNITSMSGVTSNGSGSQYPFTWNHDSEWLVNNYILNSTQFVVINTGTSTVNKTFKITFVVN